MTGHGKSRAMAREAKRRQSHLPAGPVPALRQLSITSFARVSKSTAWPVAPDKLGCGGTKRKAPADDHVSPHEVAAAPATPSKRPRYSEPGLVQIQLVVPLPPSADFAPVRSPRPSQHSSLRDPAQRRPAQKPSDAVGPGAEPSVSPPLPADLAELAGLHRALVRTIAVRIAHHGATAPIDLRELAPDVSRVWGRRRVTVDDVRRCIAVHALALPPSDQQPSDHQPIGSPFFLSDHGRGRLCLELDSRHTPAATAAAEQALCRRFEHTLAALCRRDAHRPADVDISLATLSLDHLPKAPIIPASAATALNPLLVKGYRALAEIKSERAAKEQMAKPPPLPPVPSASSTSSSSPSPAVSSTPPPVSSAAAASAGQPRLSLLDRLRLKQLARADAPPPLSSAQLTHRAALERAPDVAAVLAALSLSGRPRQAFPFPLVVQRVRDSLRVPVSQDDAAAALRVLALELAPAWVRVAAVAGREHVILEKGGQPTERQIRDSVAAATAVSA